MTDHIGSDQHYLLNEQYKDASNLNARIALHERFSTNPYDWHRWVFEQFHIPAHAKILELGCGPGKLWLNNAERIPDGWQVTLTDFSQGMLQENQRNLQAVPHHFDYHVVDAQSIPFADEMFDAVIANHMLYHVPNRAKAIAEVRRVLKPEGRFYAATNGEGHLRELDMLGTRVVAGVEIYSGEQHSFTLETGAEELGYQFAHVDLHLMEGNLVVTEVEPIIAFMRSTRLGSQLSKEHVQAMRDILTREIAEHGSFFITKSTGVFEAYGYRV
jgi:SAM-dependent methyltransferase